MLFNPNALAPEYPESAITRPFPFNGYYSEDETPEVDGKTYKLEIGGMVDNKEPWTLDKLYALPQVSQITRHVCVEGWSAIGSWQGVRLSNSSSGSAPTPAPNMSVSSAPRAIPTPSTWRRRCIRRPTELQVRQQDTAAQVRLPDEVPDADQARLQEPEIHHRALRQNNDAGGYWENQGYNWFSGL